MAIINTQIWYGCDSKLKEQRKEMNRRITCQHKSDG